MTVELHPDYVKRVHETTDEGLTREYGHIVKQLSTLRKTGMGQSEQSKLMRLRQKAIIAEIKSRNESECKIPNSRAQKSKSGGRTTSPNQSK